MTHQITPCPALATEPFVTVIYGYPGVGKTPVIAALPDCDYYDLQLGSRYSTVYGERILVDNVAGFIEQAASRRSKRRRFTVIDPITVLYDWAVQLATDEYKAKPLGKTFGEQGEQTVLDLTAQSNGKAFSPGYRFVREVFMRLVRMLWPQINNRLICVGHVRDALMADIGLGEKGGKTDAAFDGKDLDIDGKLRNIFLSECDLALYAFQGQVQAQGGGYASAFKLTSAARKAGSFVKCRCPHLVGKTFTFANPATVDDWRQIYPESIALLCDEPKDAPAVETKQLTGEPSNPPVTAANDTKQTKP